MLGDPALDVMCTSRGVVPNGKIANPFGAQLRQEFLHDMVGEGGIHGVSLKELALCTLQVVISKPLSPGLQEQCPSRDIYGRGRGVGVRGKRKEKNLSDFSESLDLRFPLTPGPSPPA